MIDRFTLALIVNVSPELIVMFDMVHVSVEEFHVPPMPLQEGPSDIAPPKAYVLRGRNDAKRKTNNGIMRIFFKYVGLKASAVLLENNIT